MTAPQGSGGLAERKGRSDYIGFRAVIKAVGTGPRGSRALTFEEAREATAGLLGGEVSPVQAGAFLIAMRIKGETPAELAGVTQALHRYLEASALSFSFDGSHTMPGLSPGKSGELGRPKPKRRM